LTSLSCSYDDSPYYFAHPENTITFNVSDLIVFNKSVLNFQQISKKYLVDFPFNFINGAPARFMTFVYLHTVLDDPNEHQKKVLQGLANYSDGLLVTREGAIDILSRLISLRASRPPLS